MLRADLRPSIGRSAVKSARRRVYRGCAWTRDQPIAYQVLENGRAGARLRRRAGRDRPARRGGARAGHLPRPGDHHPGHGRRFVAADAIASLHERGVDLRIDSAAAQSLPGAERRGAGLRRGSGDADEVEPLVRTSPVAATGIASTSRAKLTPAERWPRRWQNRAVSTAEHRTSVAAAFARALGRAGGAAALAAGRALLSGAARARRRRTARCARPSSATATGSSTARRFAG